MTQEVEIGGVMMKPCGGWDGNSFRCGRGSPRMIRTDAEVCENCARGMRKRGQATRQQEEEKARRAREEQKSIQRGVQAVRRMAGAELGLEGLVAAIERLTSKDLDPMNSFDWKLEAGRRWQVLRAFAGLEPGEWQ